MRHLSQYQCYVDSTYLSQNKNQMNHLRFIKKEGVIMVFFLHWKFCGVLIKLLHAGYYELRYSRLDYVLTQRIA